MLETGTIIRLMVGLVGAVYLLLGYMASRARPPRRATIPVIVAAGAVVAVWAVAPALLSVGKLGFPLQLRQAGLVIGGVAIGAKYLSVRRPERVKAARVAGIAATPLLCAGIAVASSNWLVAIAAVVLAAAGFVRQAEASPDESFPQSPNRPDTE